MDYEIIVMDACPASDEEAIRIAAHALYEAGCVTEDFAQACIDREKIYPTGIPSVVPIAIPHSEAENVLKKAVCILRLKEPVYFCSMENRENELPVEYVFNLAVEAGKDQIKMLQAVVRMARDHESLKLAKTMSQEEMREYFIKALTDEGDRS